MKTLVRMKIRSIVNFRKILHCFLKEKQNLTSTARILWGQTPPVPTVGNSSAPLGLGGKVCGYLKNLSRRQREGPQWPVVSWDLTCPPESSKAELVGSHSMLRESLSWLKTFKHWGIPHKNVCFWLPVKNPEDQAALGIWCAQGKNGPLCWVMAATGDGWTPFCLLPGPAVIWTCDSCR